MAKIPVYSTGIGSYGNIGPNAYYDTSSVWFLGVGNPILGSKLAILNVCGIFSLQEFNTKVFTSYWGNVIINCRIISWGISY